MPGYRNARPHRRWLRFGTSAGVAGPRSPHVAPASATKAQASQVLDGDCASELGGIWYGEYGDLDALLPVVGEHGGSVLPDGLALRPTRPAPSSR